MEDKKELNEILLGDSNNTQSSKTKKLFLMIIIAIVIILILLVVAWKMKTQDTKETPTTTDNSIQKMDTLHDATDTSDMNDDFDNMSIDDMSKSDEDSKFDKIVKDIKSKQLANQSQAEDTHFSPPAQDSSDEMLPITNQKENKASSILDNHTTENVKPAPKSTTNESSKAQSIKPAQTKPVVKKDTKPINTKKEAVPTKPKPIVKNGSNATPGHYLQVGVFNKTPNKVFMDKIRKYTYRTQTSTLNGETVTKYLIGPYKSRAEADKNLADITAKITKPVYIQIK
ncbi:SPOR domain-containing protein [Helicobacter cappadocius]|uniref:SPOR domain-containing protein n=1 Tax=Helicobacter cappadocius TaxID=3063998 RepID=A0AA90T4P9_9HELI|nr:MULTISPECIES: SPOR domain-containing protein [unclassified Helicobacter]MDO7252715.1 SPOR domain-containing protein [Helicobacter sp. faydin-H75]MDP2538583.1 SPOR domain-containing protein [Helicobacter sp. faydin-H76]